MASSGLLTPVTVLVIGVGQNVAGRPLDVSTLGRPYMQQHACSIWTMLYAHVFRCMAFRQSVDHKTIARTVFACKGVGTGAEMEISFVQRGHP